MKNDCLETYIVTLADGRRLKRQRQCPAFDRCKSIYHADNTNAYCDGMKQQTTLI